MLFEEFPKMARLTREVVITEKIDGTNAQVHIVEPGTFVPVDLVIAEHADGSVMLAGSRNRYITPTADNFGFAKWVQANSAELFALGPGRHYGEWWGGGIQRGYGQLNGDKHFSLFNVSRWHAAGSEPYVSVSADPRIAPKESTLAPACCRVVPIIFRGLFHEAKADHMLERLKANGSFAAPGFMNPEGIVVYHTASGTYFKKTLDKDEMPKSLAKSA